MIMPLRHTVTVRLWGLVILSAGLSLTGGAADCWLQNRISRNWRTPINRPPLCQHELDDDVDYYPDAYLAEMARDGINGLWISAEGLDGLATSPKRLEKLRRTVAKCAAHGIKIWLQANDPVAVGPDDPRLKSHPEWFRKGPDWSDRSVWCPSEPEVLCLIREQTARLFRAVPGLGGLINITSGEGLTTCLSMVAPTKVDYDRKFACSRCDARSPWELHNAICEAYVAGMREGNPDARLLSWFYHPSAKAERLPWVADCARHLPDGVTLVYNFESGAVKEQGGRMHSGGDYWLSFAGPAAPFRTVATAARSAGKPIAAKIQVGCSHEMATVPYVPAPGLLYRKYRGMREAGVTDVLQCWYFGNMPGVMNKAAGWLAHEDFKTDEADFLRRLARDDWGAVADGAASVWRRFSDAYEGYPLDNNMQYYGPFAAGAVWPLSTKVELRPLARTWVPGEPPSGDLIAECLGNFTLDEVADLAGTMARTCDVDLSGLEGVAATNAVRRLDLGAMKAFRCQIRSASNVFAFYRARRDGDRAAMVATVRGELDNRCELARLSAADSRLGWHSEAGAHLYDEKAILATLPGLERLLADGCCVTFADRPSARESSEQAGEGLTWRWRRTAKGIEVTGENTVSRPSLIFVSYDLYGTKAPVRTRISGTVGRFTVTMPGDAAWLSILSDTWPARARANILWPCGLDEFDNRLNLTWINGTRTGRLR